MNPPSDPQPSSIAYSVKELLSDISRKIDQIDGKLDKKADVAAVESLAGRVTLIELHGSPGFTNLLADFKDLSRTVAANITSINSLETTRNANSTTSRLWLPIVFGLLGTVLGAITYFMLNRF